MENVLNMVESDDFKISVIELSGFKFIVDRKVFEFETYGGAVSKAFDLLCEEMQFRGIVK